MAGARGEALGILRREFHRQAGEGRRMRELLAEIAPRLARHASWLLEDSGVWDDLRASCDPEGYGRLAGALGLDPVADPPGDIFLTGLSTVATYGMSWRLVLRHSGGADHEAFLDICRMEARVNGLARRIFRAARHYYRGQSVMETDRLCIGTVGRPLFRSFVSLSSNPMIAIEFGRYTRDKYKTTKVVIAIDACEAQNLGIFPATYLLASDILGLRRPDEDTSRTFPMGFADELQAHFCARWPPGSNSAVVAILTTIPLKPEERRQLEGAGLPMLDFGDLFSIGIA